MDIITELSGIDSKHRISSKYAAAEILHEGQMLFNMVLDRALSGEGLLSVRCAEACSRVVREKPEFAQERGRDILRAIYAGPKGDMRYFLASYLIYVKLRKKDSVKCAGLLKAWLEEERGKGPRACYLEAIASLAAVNKELETLAQGIIDEALKSQVPSYSARARQIVMRLTKPATRKPKP